MKKIGQYIKNHICHYPVSINLNYFWSVGSSLGLFLVLQIISGLFLAMQYIPHIDYAFQSIEMHIMYNIKNGWLVRYAHSNGASIIFILLYSHMARGLYFQSYKIPRQEIWVTGITLFILMAGTAFLGYILPWGQMSYWGATIITNIITAIPIIGDKIVIWIWGSFSVAGSTLLRFFILHFILPFIIIILSMLHLLFLHQISSSNPVGVESRGSELVRFFPYFVIKDLYFFFICLIFFFIIIGYWPGLFSHPDNCIPASPLITPSHIVPEWYFLPFYAILRAIPSKLGGALAMGGSMLLLYFLPIIDKTKINGLIFKKGYFFFLFIFFFDIILLGWIGGKAPSLFLIFIDQLLTIFYFLYFLVFLPLYSLYEYLEQKLLIKEYN